MVFEPLWTQKTTRKLCARIDDHQVLDEGYASAPIEPRDAYLQISLPEMFLCNKKEWGRGFAPLGVLQSGFVYGDSRADIPFFVGVELVREIKRFVKGEYVEYRNTRIVGPVPYMGGGVDLFVGLFRTEVTDLTSSLFQILQTIVDKFAVSSLSPYVDIAGALGDGLRGILGMQEVECRLAVRDSFSGEQGGARPLCDSYLAYVNCDETALPTDRLWVKDARLYRGVDRKSLQPLSEYDYCLLRIQGLTTRSEYTTLPFHQAWRRAREHIMSGNPSMANALFDQCCLQIANSPDLTRRNAHELILTYKSNFDQDMELSLKLQGSNRPRGPAARSVATARLSETIRAAKREGIREDMLLSLLDISQHRNHIPHLQDRRLDFEVTDAVLEEQRSAIATIGQPAEPDPGALAQAIVWSTLATGGSRA